MDGTDSFWRSFIELFRIAFKNGMGYRESRLSVDHARAFFPAAPSFFKLSGASVFGVGAFTFLAVASIEVEGHASFDARCTPLHAKTMRPS